MSTQSHAYSSAACTRLQWADTFTRELPGDTEVKESPFVNSKVDESKFRASREVRGALWSWALPEQQPNPQLISVSQEGASLVGLDAADFWKEPQAAAAAWSGSAAIEGSRPWAHNYGGHQFGVWAGQLGDGRAASLGEVLRNGQRWEIQLKGAGRTPYARFADGYAVRRSSIREYLAAEHLNALGVPTSRSLSLVFTDRTILRETPEKGAVVARMAPSWVRFGSFELPASRHDHDLTRKLADYVISRHFPGLSYAELLSRVVESTAHMVAHWQALGFCHGVMNTDNMSILGLTIDYGPFAFLDAYDAGFICNHSDPAGRYAFSEQPRVALWNLMRLAGPLARVMDGQPDPAPETVSTITAILNEFGSQFRNEYTRIMRLKFGLASARDDDLEVIIQPYLDLLQEAKTDYTFAMRTLSRVPGSVDAAVDSLAERSLACNAEAWKDKLRTYFTSVYIPRLGPSDAATQMNKVNPNFVLRNWVAQDIIDRAENGDAEWVDKALKLFTVHAFDDHAPSGMEGAEKYAGPVPEWGEGLQCSCSS